MQPANNLDVTADTAVDAAVPDTLAQNQERDAAMAIRNKALQGSVWMIGATGAAKALGFACQLTLTWFLTKEDYGVYAIAISFSSGARVSAMR